jgi:hypothetical protein
LCIRYDILVDGRELRASPVGPLVEEVYKRVGIEPDNVYPVTALPGTKIPRFGLLVTLFKNNALNYLYLISWYTAKKLARFSSKIRVVLQVAIPKILW